MKSTSKIFINVNPERFLLLKQNPATKAIISSNVIYNFEELRHIVLITSQRLQQIGIEKGDRIGILSSNNIDFVVLVLALWQISAIPVPLNSKLTKAELEELLIRANCKTLFIHRRLKEEISVNQLKSFQFPFNITSDSLFAGRNELLLNEAAVIIFTSGSENKSKGVVLSFDSLFNSAVNSNHLLRYTNSDRWLASLPFYHVGGFSIIARSLLFGIPLIIPDSLNIEDILSSIFNLQPTYISLVATQLKTFVEKGIKPNSELKNCLLGGGYSENELIKNAIELGWPVNKVYGSTETSSFVTALLTDEFIFKPNSVGRPLPSNTIKIVDENKNELKQFEIGDIAINTNALMKNYIDDSETNKVLQDGFYFTGDTGYVDEDGYLFIVGRKNYLIKTGGENVNPREVEDALLKHPMISEAAVFPIDDTKWGEIVAASVVLNEESTQLTYDDLKTFLQKNIASFKIPKKIFFEKYLPKTELGKVEKNKLINRYKL